MLFTAICSQGCHNGGTCILPDICRCSSGWTGSNCTTRKVILKYIIMFYAYILDTCHTYIPDIDLCLINTLDIYFYRL